MPTTPATSSAVNAAGTAFVTLSLGRSANAIDLLVPTAPAVHEAADLKARCFDYLSDLPLTAVLIPRYHPPLCSLQYVYHCIITCCHFCRRCVGHDSFTMELLLLLA